MSAFQYVALNAAGKEQKGVIEADNEKQARQLLRARTLVPLEIKTTSKKNENTARFSFLPQAKKLSSKDLALITRQLATLLSAGLPLEESLFAVAEQIEKIRIKELILAVRSKVLEGHSLAHAMREHPQSFSNLYCATVAAGEKSGHLDKVLTRLADYTEQQWHMRQKLRTALIYPVMIVLVALGIVGFLLEYVVPKMIAVYSHLNQTLPAMTQVLIAISNFIKSDGLYLLLALVVFGFFWARRMKINPNFRAQNHALWLRLPLIGYAMKTADTARFSRTFSILTASGVSVLDAMNISAQLIMNIPIRKAVEASVHHVREGAAIYLSLKQTAYFSPMSVHMIASGEASGQLENMLERVAANQEDEVSRLIDVALALFEPVVILIMGAIVLFIVLAVLLPIFQLNDFTG